MSRTCAITTKSGPGDTGSTAGSASMLCSNASRLSAACTSSVISTMAQRAAQLVGGQDRHLPVDHADVDQPPHPPQAGRGEACTLGQILVGQRAVDLQLFQDAAVQIVQFGRGSVCIYFTYAK